jgi:hypothetical protein
MLSAHRDAEGRGHAVTPIENNTQLREHIKRHAVDRGAAGKDNAWGWGIPDADGFIHGNIGDVVEPPEEPEEPEKPEANIIDLPSGISIVTNAEWGPYKGTFTFRTDQE